MEILICTGYLSYSNDVKEALKFMAGHHGVQLRTTFGGDEIESLAQKNFDGVKTVDGAKDILESFINRGPIMVSSHGDGIKIKHISVVDDSFVLDLANGVGYGADGSRKFIDLREWACQNRIGKTRSDSKHTKEDTDGEFRVKAYAT